jgi:CubicO group peptidase (beta-lactamase class C family)
MTGAGQARRPCPQADLQAPAGHRPEDSGCTTIQGCIEEASMRLIIITSVCCAVFLGSAAATADGLDRTGTLWAPYLEWSLENPSWQGNPFDVEATATFTHDGTGEERTTPMFYDGANTWKFRFTATRTGNWSFHTSSDDADLHGQRGAVAVRPHTDPTARRGFLVRHQNKYAWQVDEDGRLAACAPNVYMNLRTFGNPEACGWTAVSPTFSDPQRFAAYLDEVEAHGCNAAFALLANQWFQAGAASSGDHESINPDPATFRALEQAIVAAHRRGMHLEIWAWGDEQRRWTPIGAGGINGAPDRRVQRYIAARLGPLPGWTMSYGFDLNEWVKPGEVTSWAEYLNQHSGWKHLLSARQVTRAREQFQSPDILAVAAHDDTPTDAFYELALERLTEEPRRPVLFARRFTYLRDGVWDMPTTRRAFWEFTLAGGAGAVWGHYPADPKCSAHVAGTYPHPEQLRTHRRFWSSRFLLEMVPANGLSNDDDTRVLRAGERIVFYRPDAESIHLDLSDLKGPQPAIAVDTTNEYAEVDLGSFPPGKRTWRAPHRSDWAIAVGSFEDERVRSATPATSAPSVRPRDRRAGSDTAVEFPGESWDRRDPTEAGLDPQKLQEFADAIGGDGVVIRDGYLVKSWGAAARRSDWASSAKPLISTLLLFAVHEGRINSVDEPVRPWVRKRWPQKDLSEKDREMIFRHLANMTSGYARGEPPGTHWAYNDFAIQLYRDVMIEVLGESLNEAALRRLAVLQFEDGDLFGSRGGGGVNTSPRDFARIGWFWLNRGNWNGSQLLPERLFDQCMRPDVPGILPKSKQEGRDYLDIGSYGGGSDQDFAGQGVYGFNWWFNSKMADGEELFLTHLPQDAYCTIGHRGKEVMLIVPSLSLVVAARGDWGGVRLNKTRILREALH